MKLKKTSGNGSTLPGISRRHAVSRLLQIVAGTVGLGSMVGCPGGSTWERNKLIAAAEVEETPQIGSLNPAGNLELSAADVPTDSPLELRIEGQKAYLLRGQTDGEDVWFATSRVCTHMRCTVEFNAKKQEYQCPCHNSSFSLDGTVLKPPAKSDLQSWQVIAKGNVLEIVLEQAPA